jgi:hypothetical protein
MISREIPADDREKSRPTVAEIASFQPRFRAMTNGHLSKNRCLPRGNRACPRDDPDAMIS